MMYRTLSHKTDFEFLKLTPSGQRYMLYRVSKCDDCRVISIDAIQRNSDTQLTVKFTVECKNDRECKNKIRMGQRRPSAAD